MHNVQRLSPRAFEPRLDLDAIAALEAVMGPEATAYAFEDGMIEATERLVTIERALEEENWTRVARAARELSGIAARVGLVSVAGQAEALERCCEALDRHAAHAVGQRLLRTSEAALCWVMSGGR